MKVNHKGNYQERRRHEYPGIEDQLDAIWKALDTLHSNGQNLDEAQTILNQIKAIKTKYPKRAGNDSMQRGKTKK